MTRWRQGVVWTLSAQLASAFSNQLHRRRRVATLDELRGEDARMLVDTQEEDGNGEYRLDPRSI
jgi:hypothetical protein